MKPKPKMNPSEPKPKPKAISGKHPVGSGRNLPGGFNKSSALDSKSFNKKGSNAGVDRKIGSGKKEEVNAEEWNQVSASIGSKATGSIGGKKSTQPSAVAGKAGANIGRRSPNSGLRDNNWWWWKSFRTKVGDTTMADKSGSAKKPEKKKGSAVDTYRSSANLGRVGTGKPYQSEFVARFRGKDGGSRSTSFGINKNSGTSGASASGNVGSTGKKRGRPVGSKNKK